MCTIKQVYEAKTFFAWINIYNDDGIKVIVIGIGSNATIDEQELLTLVKSPSYFHRAEDFGVLLTNSFMKTVVDCEKLAGKQ